jgi:acyl-CoA dehydrogenase
VIEPLLTAQQKDLRDEVREFVKLVPRQLLCDMDDNKVRYPKEYVVNLAKSKLLGLRFNTQYGGRGLKWCE